MTQVGKVLVVLGLVLVVAGAAVWALGRAGFKGLPGDVVYEGERVRVYVPIVTCLVLSLLATGVLWLLQRLGGR